MKSLKKLMLLVAAVAGLSTLTSCDYNSLVEKRNQVDQSWAQVENVYQRRSDLIPNLVNTVKGYAAHEQETLQAVTDARTRATSVNVDIDNLDEASLAKFQQAQGELTQALGRLIAVSEAYPDLKANENFLNLQAQLEGTENRIATERQRYTEAVKEYNTSIQKFPTNIYAGWFGFEKKPQFQAQEGADKVPTVEF